MSMRISLCLGLAAVVASGCRTTGGATQGSAAKSEADVTAAADAPWDQDTFDPADAEEIGNMFAKLVSSRHPPGTANVKRAVFLKPHGCATARFEVLGDLPERYRQGLFAAASSHDAWVRLSSDTVPSTSDFKNSTIGFAVKVLGVPGEKVLAGEESFTTHDFLTQNHPVFFVDTARDFREFTAAIFAGTLPAYLAAHPRTDEILNAMEKPVANVLASRYWSTTPYRFGAADFAKYAVRPCGAVPDEPAPPSGETGYLRKRLERDLKAAGACFELQVQLREGSLDAMPLDRATVEWNETDSPPLTVAKITVPAQDIALNDRSCERMAFTAWHALPAHRPVGSVNKARGYVYKRLSDDRRTRNGVPIGEP
jgi:hypothetical protein